MKILSSIFILGFVLSSCHQKNANQLFFDQADISKSTLNSVIEAKVIKPLKDKAHQTGICQKHVCYASIEIIQIIQNGQNYHGQFVKGDTIEAFFNFTLGNTQKLFPHLNKTLPGLKRDDIFLAELFEKQSSESMYNIQLYAIKN